MITLGDLIDEHLEMLRSFRPERYPVKNREPREPIGARLWHLIHERDGGECWMCHRKVEKGAGEVDHLIPRSAFNDVREADKSWNLRLACVDCNQAKSNFTVPILPRTFGVTLKCWDCHERRDLGRPDPSIDLEALADWEQGQGPVPELTEIAYCGSCGFMSWVPGKGWIL